MPKKIEKKKNEITFEDALFRLEEIVELLESGENPLEKSLELFEEGVGLVKLCNSKLENVENSVKILIISSLTEFSL